MTKPPADPNFAPVKTPFGTFQYKYIVMVLYMLALFMQVVDGTALNVAIPTLAKYFDVPVTDIDWAIIGYLLGLTSMLPAGGWLANRFGSRKVFLTALTIFVFASLLCGIAGSLGQLILFRIFQGAGSGVLTPVGSALLISAFPLAERAKASTTIIGVVVIAPAIGPVLGGFLVQYLSWRWIFFVNLPIGALALALGFAWLQSMPRKEAGSLDVAGLVLAAVGLSGLLFGISEGPNRGFTSGVVLASVAVGVACLVALGWWQLRASNPLLHLGLFRERLFRACNMLAFPAYMGFMGLIFVMPIFLQSFLEYSPLQTGLAMMPQPLGVLLASQFVGRIFYAKVGPRRLIIVGLLGGFAASALLSRIDLETGMATVMALMLFRGLFMTLLFIPIQTAVYAKTQIPDMPSATTLFSIVRQAAPAFGVALAASWLAARSPDGVERASDAVLTTAEKLEGLGAFQEAMLVSAIPFLIAAALALSIHDEDAAETMVKRAR